MSSHTQNQPKTANGTLSIEKSSGQITTQDGGRWGNQHTGVSPSGAADHYAFGWANRLLDNPPNCTVIELLFGQCTLHFDAPTQIALCGADCRVRLIDPSESPTQTYARKNTPQPVHTITALNNTIINNWSSITIEANTTLLFSAPKTGLYTYLAIKDGFNIKPVLGSCSINLREKIGPNNGRAFQAGAHLHYTPNPSDIKHLRGLHWSAIPQYRDERCIRIIPSQLGLSLNTQCKKNIETQRYTLTASSNKMGLKLKGEAMSLTSAHPYSEGVVAGSIQIPPNGQPVILMTDHQTIGGYPLLGTVYKVDLTHLAQCRPGQAITFKFGSIEEAQALFIQQATLVNTPK